MKYREKIKYTLRFFCDIMVIPECKAPVKLKVDVKDNADGSLFFIFENDVILVPAPPLLIL